MTETLWVVAWKIEVDTDIPILKCEQTSARDDNGEPQIVNMLLSPHFLQGLMGFLTSGYDFASMSDRHWVMGKTAPAMTGTPFDQRIRRFIFKNILTEKDYYMMLGRIEAYQLSEIIKRQKWYK